MINGVEFSKWFQKPLPMDANSNFEGNIHVEETLSIKTTSVIYLIKSEKKIYTGN